MYKKIKQGDVELPIVAFCINGYSSQKIELIIKEKIGFSDTDSHEAGYDVICNVIIDAGCYHVQGDCCFSTTKVLYHFGEELMKCYENLAGEAAYHMTFDNNLDFSVIMTGRGHAVVRGTYRERFDIRNILEFEIETDQSFLLPVIQYLLRNRIIVRRKIRGIIMKPCKITETGNCFEENSKGLLHSSYSYVAHWMRSG